MEFYKKALLVVLAIGAFTTCKADPVPKRASAIEPKPAASPERTSRWHDWDRMTNDESAQFRHCEKESDCVYVTNGCCDCANGGGDLAVNKNMVDAFKKTLDCPQAKLCTMMGVRPPCGSGVITCKKGLCEYRRSKQHHDDATGKYKYPNGVVPEAELLSYRRCQADTDCVYVNNTCCNCATIGKEISLNKDKVDSFHDDFRCEEFDWYKEFKCPKIDRDPPCGSGRNICKDGLCTYIMPQLKSVGRQGTAGPANDKGAL